MKVDTISSVVVDFFPCNSIILILIDPIEHFGRVNCTIVQLYYSYHFHCFQKHLQLTWVPPLPASQTIITNTILKMKKGKNCNKEYKLLIHSCLSSIQATTTNLT